MNGSLNSVQCMFSSFPAYCAVMLDTCVRHFWCNTSAGGLPFPRSHCWFYHRSHRVCIVGLLGMFLSIFHLEFFLNKHSNNTVERLRDKQKSEIFVVQFLWNVSGIFLQIANIFLQTFVRDMFAVMPNGKALLGNQISHFFELIQDFLTNVS